MSRPSAVQHLPDEGRFVYRADGHEARLLYRLHGGVVDFPSTVVPDALGGRGVGSQLARAALDFARAGQLTVRPTCWFVKGWIDRHPEYADLVSSDFTTPAA